MSNTRKRGRSNIRQGRGNTRVPFEVEFVRSSQPELALEEASPIYHVDFDGSPVTFLTHGRRLSFCTDRFSPRPPEEFNGWRVKFDAEYIVRPHDFFADGDVPVAILEKKVAEYAKRNQCVPMPIHFLVAMLARPAGIPQHFFSPTYRNYLVGTVVTQFPDMTVNRTGIVEKWIPYFYYEDELANYPNGFGHGFNCGMMNFGQLGSLTEFCHRPLFVPRDAIEFVCMLDDEWRGYPVEARVA